MRRNSSTASGDGKLVFLISTVPGCHALGASLSIGLILVTAWVWFLGHASVATVNCGNDEIDLGEAITLIENQDQWRELSRASFEEQEHLDLRSDTITEWLQGTVEFKSVENALLALGEDVQLHLFSIQQGELQVGQRVAVLTVSCEAQGSFTALCRFLHHLPLLSQPIACSELKLQREEGDSDFSADLQEIVDDQPCRATLILRIPYAAAGTASWSLLKEPGHAI